MAATASSADRGSTACKLAPHLEGGSNGGQAVALRGPVGRGAASMLDGAEGTRRGRRELRGREGEVVRGPAGDPRADRPETVPLDRVRGRLGLPRGIQGHGAANPRGQFDGGAPPAAGRFDVIVPDEIEAYAAAHT